MSSDDFSYSPNTTVDFYDTERSYTYYDIPGITRYVSDVAFNYATTEITLNYTPWFNYAAFDAETANITATAPTYRDQSDITNSPDPDKPNIDDVPSTGGDDDVVPTEPTDPTTPGAPPYQIPTYTTGGTTTTKTEEKKPDDVDVSEGVKTNTSGKEVVTTIDEKASIEDIISAIDKLVEDAKAAGKPAKLVLDKDSSTLSKEGA